ncbi:nuclear transport factor 2 family protein [Spirosoma koreense]
MEKTNLSTTPINEAKDIVLAFVDALNAEDFDAGRRLANDDMTFVGVLGSRDGADAYFGDMKKMKLKYAVRKVIAEGDDVCLFYDLSMSGVTFFGCGWYRVESGKVASLRVIFDPRPVLEASSKK